MTKPNDTNEPSLASAGSHGEPVAWAVMLADGQRIYDVYGIEEEAKAIDEAVTGNHGVVPLYRSPTLTDEEREAVDRVRIAFRDMDHNDMTMQQIEDYEAICDLLERTK
jgi:hypothetical protein